MKSYFEGKKVELPCKELYEMYLDKERTAVLTVDMHKGHLAEDPECPAPASRGREIIEPINHFTEECRQRGIPVIHVRSVLRKDGADDIKGNISAWRVLRMYREDAKSISETDSHGLEGSKWIEFCLDVKQEDYIIDGKKRLSAFYPTDLELLLRNMKKDIIVITGALTDCCILSTTIEGANHDFRMVVPKDLTRGYKPYEESALGIISRYFGLVVDSIDLLNEWDK